MKNMKQHSHHHFYEQMTNQTQREQKDQQQDLWTSACRNLSNHFQGCRNWIAQTKLRKNRHQSKLAEQMQAEGEDSEKDAAKENL